MIEDSSLVLLANVALDNRPRILQKECRQRRESRTKTLRITNLNGESHAEITDLKCMPISTLFRIFVEKFEDRKLRCFVYVCKYELNYCCNTRFIDVKENRINRLEHLVQCHLLEHLTKTKTGSMIKLPKSFSMTGKTTPSISQPRPVVAKMKYEEIDWGSEEEKNSDSSVIEGEKEVPKVVPIQEPKEIEVDSCRPILKRKKNKTEIKKSELGSIKADTSAECYVLRRVKFDHPYSNSNEPSSKVIPVSSNRCVGIPIEYRNVDVDKLYYLNGEASSELNSFMIYETLNQQVSVMTMGDVEPTTEQLPLVGCEAEVTTEKESISETLTHECSSKTDESYFPCLKCDIVLSTKHMLHSHVRNRHSDSTPIKSNRVSQKSAELKTAKRKFEIITEYRNTDFYEVIKENKMECDDKRVKRVDASILKTALLKESNKKPVINISNVWNNINVQYV